ncbi:hypothetical protein [Pedobacter sp. D749]|uniref:hypothetical protein n=1 Tax=Pedobacter sp. D749 TaxID=2856523 RepID=UPI001C55BA8D|nr:hypothetical protein [Pedobacter sp. D749]QXU43163.1 hypothetical protein KYH19_06135 [Pedobacter sp. D749]
MKNIFSFFFKKYFKIEIPDNFGSVNSLDIDSLTDFCLSENILCTFSDLNNLQDQVINFSFLFYDFKKKSLIIVKELSRDKVYIYLSTTNFYIPYSRDKFMSEMEGIVILLLDNSYALPRRVISLNYYQTNLVLFILIQTLVQYFGVFFYSINFTLSVFLYFKLAQYKFDYIFTPNEGSVCSGPGLDCNISKITSLSSHFNLATTGLFFLTFINIFLYQLNICNNLGLKTIFNLIVYFGLSFNIVLFFYNLFLRKNVCLKCLSLQIFYSFYFINIISNHVFIKNLTQKASIWNLIFVGFTLSVLLSVCFLICGYLIGEYLNKKRIKRDIDIMNRNMLDIPNDELDNFLSSILKINSMLIENCSINNYVLIFYDVACHPCYNEALEYFNLYSGKYYDIEVIFVPVFFEEDLKEMILSYLKVKAALFNVHNLTEVNLNFSEGMSSISSQLDVKEEANLFKHHVLKFLKTINVTIFPCIIDRGRFVLIDPKIK